MPADLLSAETAVPPAGPVRSATPPPPPFLERLVTTAVGLVLLTAAALKIAGLSASPVVQVGWLSNPATQSAVGVGELALGGWLLSGLAPRLGWAVAVAAFATFAAVSGRAALAGQPSCNCFGPLAVNPWWVCGFDLAVLAVLAAVRPSFDQFRRELVRVGGTLAGTLGVAAALTVAWHAGVGTRFDRVVLGRVIEVDTTADFGTVQPGGETSLPVRVRNHGRTPVAVVGGTSDCSCLVTEVPVTVPPGETRTVPVRLRVPLDACGQVYRRIELWTDSGRQPRLPVTVGFNSEVTIALPVIAE